MYDVSHIQARPKGRPRGASKYLAALKAVEHPMTAPQVAYVVGKMTGEEPLPSAAYMSLRALILTQQVAKLEDGRYAALV